MNQYNIKTLDDLFAEWEKDSQIDKLRLGDENLKTPKLLGKYLQIRSWAKMQVVRFDVEHNKMVNIKHEYFKGNLNTKENLEKYGLGEPFRAGTISNTEIPRVLKADSQITDLIIKKAYYQEIVDACQYIVEELKSRNYSLGNTMKWEIFQNGG